MIRAVLTDSLIYGLATILSRGLAILTVPFYTRMLSPADFGVLDLVSTLAVLVMIVVPLEVGQGLARLWGDEEEAEGQRRLAGTAFWFSALAYVMFALLSLALSPWLSDLLQLTPQQRPALQLGLVVAAATGLFFALQNQFRWELRSREFAGTSLLYAVLMVGLGVLLGGVLGLGLGGILTGQLLAAMAGGAVSFLLLRPSLAFAIDRARLRSLLAFSWPLVFSGVATFLSLYANRLILNSLATLEDVGIYAVGHRVATLAALVIVGVQGALTPLIYAHHREPGTPSQLATLFSGFVAVALMACLGAALFAPELLRIFAPAGYVAATGLVAVLAPAALLSQMYIFAPGIALGKKTLWQLGVFAASAAVSVALSLLLVPLHGAAGAAWSALVSALVFLALWVAVSQRWYPVPFEWRRIVLALAAFLGCTVLHQWALPLIPGFWPGLLARTLLLGLLAGLLLATGLVRVGQLRALMSRRAAS